MTKRKKKVIDKYDFSKLTQSQIDFIDTMVRALGSAKAVATHYNNNDTVGEFARTLVRVYFPGTDV